MKPEFTFSALSKTPDRLLGMVRAVRLFIREEAESDGFFSAFLHGIAGYALLFLMITIEFSFAVVYLLDWVRNALEQFAPSTFSRRQCQPTKEFSQPA